MSDNVEIPDAVMSAFTAAFGSVAKVRELELKVKALETERDTHKAAAEALHTSLDTTVNDKEALKTQIADLEAKLSDATKSKAEADSRISLILDALRGVASEATAAVSLVEPPPQVVISNEVPTPNPTSTDVPVTSETSNGVQSSVADGSQSATDPTNGVVTPVDISSKSADATMNEGERAVPFTASSTDAQATPATPSSTELAASPSDTASSSTPKVYNNEPYWFKPVGLTWEEWHDLGGLIPSWIDPDTFQDKNFKVILASLAG